MKKQENAKKVNKPLSKKVAPFVMSTSMVAATFLAAGAPISAAELEGKGVNPEAIEQIEQAKKPWSESICIGEQPERAK